MAGKVETRFLQIQARAGRGFGSDLSDTRFLLSIIESQEKRIRELRSEREGTLAELDNKLTDLEKLHEDPLPLLAARGWIRKLTCGRLCLIWRVKEIKT